MVFIIRFVAAAAIFSVAFAAPSPRLARRGDNSPSKEYKGYEDSYKSSEYQGSNYQESQYKEEPKHEAPAKSHQTTAAVEHQITEAPKYEYNNAYNKEYTTEEVKHETKLEQKHETKTYVEEPKYTEAPKYTEEPKYEYETSTDVELETSTSAAYESYPTYGSGSSNWDSEGYEDCVSKCLATYGNKDTWYKPTATSGGSEESAGSVGTGATHTVIVAPTKGVFRYIPFAVNASVGDTVKFMWGADNHTVTKGSSLLPCNKTGDALFTSGPKNQSFVFTQVVNTTDPTYFFCNTPTHCQKGMFGIINPPREAGAPTSASFMMQDLAAKSPDLKAYASIVDQQTVNNEAARNWGSDIGIGSLPEWAQTLAAENIQFTRSVLAKNPEFIKDDGSVNLGSVETTPMFIPDDVAVALSNAASTPAGVTAPVAPPPSATSAPAGPIESASGASAQNSASALGSPRVLVAVMVVVATFLAL